MKCLVLFAAFVVSVNASAQPAGVISEPQQLSSTARRMVRSPTFSKQGPVIGGMDRVWHDLIIDSKDNLYAHEGKVAK